MMAQTAFCFALIAMGHFTLGMQQTNEAEWRTEEDGTREDYDPETCVVFQSGTAVVKNQDCMRSKFGDYLDDERWKPVPSADGSVCNIHSCNATSDDLRETQPELYKGHLEFLGLQGQPFTEVEYFDGCPNGARFAERYVYKHKPAVFRGCALSQPALKWTEEMLKRKASETWSPLQETQKKCHS